MRSLLTKGICLALALSAAGTALAAQKESHDGLVMKSVKRCCTPLLTG
ncbi:hypothetical protein [Enterobacter sp.]|nr:hypothetical protein [Enterobacter sp.]